MAPQIGGASVDAVIVRTRLPEYKAIAAATAGEPCRTGRQVNAATERTEESRGWLPRQLGDPVREPAPDTVATGSAGHARRQGTAKRGGKGLAGYPRKTSSRMMAVTAVGQDRVARRTETGPVLDGDGEVTSPARGHPRSRLAAARGGGGQRCIMTGGVGTRHCRGGQL